MSRVGLALRAIGVAAYAAYTLFFAWSVFDSRSVQWACLIVFGVLCALPAYLCGRRATRTPRRVSSTPLDTRR